MAVGITCTRDSQDLDEIFLYFRIQGVLVLTPNKIHSTFRTFPFNELSSFFSTIASRLRSVQCIRPLSGEVVPRSSTRGQSCLKVITILSNAISKPSDIKCQSNVAFSIQKPRFHREPQLKRLVRQGIVDTHSLPTRHISTVLVTVSLALSHTIVSITYR